MRAPGRFFRALISDQKGATAVEYGLIVALIVIAMVGALMTVAETTSSIWTSVSDKVQTAH
jgi:pilus assembly protein Flp/PilA